MKHLGQIHKRRSPKLGAGARSTLATRPPGRVRVVHPAHIRSAGHRRSVPALARRRRTTSVVRHGELELVPALPRRSVRTARAGSGLVRRCNDDRAANGRARRGRIAAAASTGANFRVDFHLGSPMAQSEEAKRRSAGHRSWAGASIPQTWLIGISGTGIGRGGGLQPLRAPARTLVLIFIVVSPVVQSWFYKAAREMRATLRRARAAKRKTLGPVCGRESKRGCGSGSGSAGCEARVPACW